MEYANGNLLSGVLFIGLLVFWWRWASKRTAASTTLVIENNDLLRRIAESNDRIATALEAHTK